MKKTLGKLESKLLQKLRGKGKKIFCLSDARPITKSGYDATRVLVGKLARTGWLTRIKRGKFLILSLDEKSTNLKHWYLVASALVAPYPYYISYYSAFSLHGMTTQPILTVFVSTSKRFADRIISNVKFKFINCRLKGYWGIEEMWINKQDKIKVSNLEKTIIDSLSRPELCGGLSEAAKGIWLKRNEIDYVKLLQYTIRLGIKAVSKRLGYILNLYALKDKSFCNKLKIGSSSYCLLDPSLPKKGDYSKEWKLIINVNNDELMKIIWT